MAEPVNPICTVAGDDVNLPIAGTVNKILPSNAILTTGYDKDQTVFAQNINYVLNNLAQWVAYSQERSDDLQSQITALTAQIEQERVSVGEIIAITGDPTNPATLKGYGTWVATAQGRALVGAGSFVDPNGVDKNWADGDSEGEYNHTQTEAELAAHGHSVSGTTDTEPDHTHGIPSGTSEAGANQQLDIVGDVVASRISEPAGAHSHSLTGTASSTGSSSPMNNVQPVQAVYYWKRTA